MCSKLFYAWTHITIFVLIQCSTEHGIHLSTSVIPFRTRPIVDKSNWNVDCHMNHCPIEVISHIFSFVLPYAYSTSKHPPHYDTHSCMNKKEFRTVYKVTKPQRKLQYDLPIIPLRIKGTPISIIIISMTEAAVAFATTKSIESAAQIKSRTPQMYAPYFKLLDVVRMCVCASRKRTMSGHKQRKTINYHAQQMYV